ncbi:MAG: DUF4079 domain-containing protein [Spirulinaceae cyanobacterium SM2_1_0]|nr:DUF4079 domain-containing protein [Spirulinaceae cyanobacterium SM2_1_0]
MSQIRPLLEPVAAWFRQLGTPEPIVQWGHPLMMSIVIFVMGSFVGWAGWRGRILAATGGEAALKPRQDHRQLAPWLFVFIALGYIGGVLSLAIQEKPLLQSPHFWTGSVAVAVLGLNGVLSLSGFFGDKTTVRNLHAYLGSAALMLLAVHALLGLQLGLSL